MVQQKIIMKKEVRAMKQVAEKIPIQVTSLAQISNKQQQQLGVLLYEAFHGSLDDRGETPEEMAQEIIETLAGKYGTFLGEHSYVYTDETTNQIVGTVLVSLFRGVPLILYVCVKPEFRGKGIASLLLQQLVCSFATTSQNEVYLVVMSDNTPAETMYRRIGFVEAGKDWDEVLLKQGK